MGFHNFSPEGGFQMNKLLSYLIASFIAVPAMANTVTIVSDDSAGELIDLPQELIGLLYDNGVKPQEIPGNKFVVEASDIHCDYRHNGALDTPYGGVPSTTCRIGSENVKDSEKGERLAESRAFVELMSSVEGLNFMDCAMGYCGGFVKKITCTIDGNKDTYKEGMFSCTLHDGHDERR